MPPSTTAGAGRRSRLRLLVLGSAGAAVALALVLLGVASSRPFEAWLRSALEAELAASFGPGARLGQLELQPWRLAARLDGLELRLGERAALIQVGQGRVRLSPAALLAGRLRAAALDLDAARIEIDLDDPYWRAGRGAAGDAVPPRLRFSGCTLGLRSGPFAVRLDEASGRLARSPAGLEVTFTGRLARAAVSGRELAGGGVEVSAHHDPANGLALDALAAALATGPLTLRGRAGGARADLDLALEAEVDLAALARILDGAGQLAGRARIAGRLLGTPSRPRLEGELRSPRVLAAGLFPLEDFAARVLAGRERVALADGSARLFSGTARLSGDAPLDGSEPARLRVEVRAADLERTGDSSSRLPLRSGRADLRGEVILPQRGRPSRLEATVEVKGAELRVRERFQDPRLRHALEPISGRARVRYESRVVELRDIEAANAWTSATGTARLPLDGAGRIELELRGAELGPVTGMEGPPLPWLDRLPHYRLEGRLDGTLAWSGTAEDPELTLAGTAAVAHLVGPARDSPPATELRSLGVSLAYRAGGLRWEAGAGGPLRVRASGEAELGETGRIPQTLAAYVSGWEAGGLGKALGFPLALAGSAELLAELRSDGRGWQGEVRLAGPFGPRPGRFDRTEVALELAAREIGIRTVRLEAGSGSIAARGSFRYPDRRLGVDLDIDAFDLAALGGAPGSLGGAAAGRVRIEGLWPEPGVQGGLDLSGLAVGGVALGDWSAALGGTAARLAATFRRGRDIEVVLVLAARPPFPWSASATLEALDVTPWLARAFPTLPGTLGGRATGRAFASGEVTVAPAVREVRLELARGELYPGGIPIALAGPVAASWTPALGLALDEVRLVGPDTELVVVPAASPAGLAVRLTGRTDLKLLTPFFPALGLKGALALDLEYGRGGLAGKLELARGQLRSPHLPHALRDVTGLVRVDGPTIGLDDLSAAFASGTLRARGRLDLTDPARPALELEATGRDLPAALFGDLDVRADADLRYVISPDRRRRLSGTLQVTRAVYRAPRGGLASRPTLPGLLGGGGEALVGFPETSLDLEIVATGNLWYVSEQAKLEGDAVLRLAGTTADPTLLGSIRYLAQERFQLEGRSYRVLAGSLVFDRPRELDPRLDFEAETVVAGHRIVLGLTGRLSRPQVTARSDPPLSPNDVLALVAGARAEDEGTIVTPSGGDEILRSLFLPQAVGRLTRGHVFIDPTALGGRADPTEVLPLKIPIGAALDVTAGLPLAEARPGLFVLNWRSPRGISLSAVRDFGGSWAAEVTQALRFGGARRAVEAGTTLLGAELDVPAGLPVPELAAALALKPGRPVTRARLREASSDLLRALRERGWPLARVGLGLDRDPARGSITATYSVEPGPRVEITTSGHRLARSERRRLLETVESFGVYPDTPLEIERELRARQERRGHPRSLVACETRDAPGGAEVRIACEIDPGRRQLLSAVRIEGETVAEDRLRPALRTRPRWLQRARFVTAEVSEDAETIARLHREEGWLDATARAELVAGTNGGDLELVFHVRPGTRYVTGRLEVRGQAGRAEAERAVRAVLVEGAPHHPAAVESARLAALAALDPLGLLDARARVLTSRDSVAGTVDVTIDLESGVPAALGAVRIRGLERTREATLRRALRLAPGAALSWLALAAAQRRAQELGLFRSVELRLAPVAGRPELRDVEVVVEEASPVRLEGGFGWDSVDGARGALEVADSNLGGRGRFLGLQTRASARLLRGQLLLRDPAPLGAGLPGLLTAYVEDREEVSFALLRWALRAEIERRLGRRQRNRLTLRYALSDTRIRHLSVSAEQAGAEDLRLSGLGAALVLDDRDDPLEPHRGGLLSVDLAWSTRALGSEADFVQVTAKGYLYRRLLPALVWAQGLQLGAGLTPGRASRLPLAERYFAGGASTLRALEFQRAGPRDPQTGQPAGGDALVILNQELRLELPAGLVASVFVDAGQVFREASDLSPGDLTWSAGVGLRWRGLVLAGLDWAHRLDRSPGEPASRLHFALGYAF